MPTVNFVYPDGRRQSFSAPPGGSVMQVALLHGIPSIKGECGGSMMCATCHVYIDERDIDSVGAVSAVENEMLDCTSSPRRVNSRLACQLMLTSQVNELTVHLPQE